MNPDISDAKANPEGSPSFYDALIYKLFQPPPQTHSNAIVLAFTSVNRGEGVTHVVESLIDSVQLELAIKAVKVDMEWVKCQPLLDPESQRFPHGRSATAWMSGWEHRRSTIEQLRRQSQIVAIDCPALSVSLDLLSLASLVDGVVLIVEADRTRKSDLREAERRIEAAGGKILGLILNKYRRPMPTFMSRWFGLDRESV